MAEPLKHQFGLSAPAKLADMIYSVHATFPAKCFLKEVSEGYESLELMQRAWRIAIVLHHFLPSNYEDAIKIIVSSLGSVLDDTKSFGMSSFLYLPYVFYVAEYGLEHFDLSMQAQYELTQRFTAEFSIRSYLERYPEASLVYLRRWVVDENVHVRRLVSEGTRPRLPWAARLRIFEPHYSEVLPLLEQLRDDSDLYVRRSVANHLNDISKDSPDLLVNLMKQWSIGASAQRQWVIRHALRSLVKKGHAAALAVMGFEPLQSTAVEYVTIVPNTPKIGEFVHIAFDLTNTDQVERWMCVDICVHFVKANGMANPKVFKLKELSLLPNESVRLAKKISLAKMTTRQHYAGIHCVKLILNGRQVELGVFDLRV